MFSSIMRFTRRIFLSLLLISLLVGIPLWWQRTAVVERVLSKQLGTQVHVGNIDLSWGELVVRQLAITNPPDFTLPYALRAEEIHLNFTLKALFLNPTILQQLTINQCEVSWEALDAANQNTNWNRLLHQAPTNSPIATAGFSSQPSKVIIETLEINNISLQVLNRQLNKRPINLPPVDHLVLKQVGADENLPVAQLLALTFQQLFLKMVKSDDLFILFRNLMDKSQQLLSPFTSSKSSSDQ